ncbi:dihydroorotase [Puia dinghuensis]|uniref:Dihydroorotase n=1 Tax=Puia dinghuensis TaxID=1792502 RepID=A0A8J2UEE5_9BACT|nr:dihydroorotase [Puia dinghuensis]GGB06164.1 dihydroorotase [Puia dinghuensis]
MHNYLIKNVSIVNEGRISTADLLLKNGRIEKIGTELQPSFAVTEINGEGLHLLPGVIDEQCHFREPGLTHKATIYTEARAAVAGGVTSFMEMPNTLPPVFTQQLLEDKYAIGARSSLANYSFYMGTSNDNADEALRTNEKKKDICGIKIFMGSSTGNLLVDNYLTLDKLFRESEVLIATHCEDEKIIRQNLERFHKEGRELVAADHPLIRNEEACFESSLTAIQFAKKHNSRLHVFHLSTEKEMSLFSNMLPLADKRITAEVCVHHLHFTSDDYAVLGNRIKCNPAIKAPHNREALWKALLDDRLDLIATDHAPHTLTEKGLMRTVDGRLVPDGEPNAYERAHAGLPLVQHSLLLMLHYVREGRISLEKVVEKMSHAVATCFRIAERGFIREGYFADLVLVDLNRPSRVSPASVLYKCGWSPLEGFEFPATVTHTFVNGHLVYGNGRFDESQWGQRLRFDL